MRKSQDARQSDNRGVAVVFRFSASANYACAGLRSQGVRRLGVVRQGDEPSGINRLYCEEGLTVRKTGSAARSGVARTDPSRIQAERSLVGGFRPWSGRL
jgi:hypothetical protein